MMKRSSEEKTRRIEDTEVIEELMRHPGWEVLSKRIEAYREMETNKVISSHSWEEVLYHKGKLHAALEIMSIPKQVIKEGKLDDVSTD